MLVCMTAAVVDISTLIETIPGVNGGKPSVVDVGVSVHQAAILFASGRSDAEIAASYPGLTLAGVHAALAHYFANRELIEAEIDAQDELAQRLMAAFPDGIGPQSDLAGLDEILRA